MLKTNVNIIVEQLVAEEEEASLYGIDYHKTSGAFEPV